MSLTTANLAAVLSVQGKLSPGDVERLREQWRRACSDPHRVLVLDPGNRPPPGRDHYLGGFFSGRNAGLPIPFRWGPNGPLLLLFAMLAIYAAVIALCST